MEDGGLVQLWGESLLTEPEYFCQPDWQERKVLACLDQSGESGAEPDLVEVSTLVPSSDGDGHGAGNRRFVEAMKACFHRPLLILLLTASIVSCAVRSRADSESIAAVSGAPRLAMDQLEKDLAAEVDQGRLPNIAVVVARRGEVVHSFRFGHADLQEKTTLQEDTIYRIYSMTKPVTAVAALILVDEGKLQLDEPAGQYLPVLSRMSVLGSDSAPDSTRTLQHRPMLIRDLLRHTSGLPYGYSAAHPVDATYRSANILDRRGTLEDMIGKLDGLPLRYSPGERWHYGLSSDVLGRVVEVASGQSLEEFCRERIFDPLGMPDTTFELPPEKAHRLAGIYSRGADGKLIPWGGSIETSTYIRPVTFYSGGGGLVSTMPDYLRFCQMLLNRGTLDGVRILSPETVEMMTSNQLEGNYRPGWGYGFGVQVRTETGTAGDPGEVGQFSWGGGGNTFFFVDPKRELIAMVWTQFSGGTTLANDLRKAVYASQEDATLAAE